MPVVLFLMHVCVVMFFLGIAGSLIVVLLSSIEDIHELLGE